MPWIKPVKFKLSLRDYLLIAIISIIAAIVVYFFICSTAHAATLNIGGGMTRPHNDADAVSLDPGYVLLLSYGKSLHKNLNAGLSFYHMEYEKAQRPNGYSSKATSNKSTSDDIVTATLRPQFNLGKWVKPFGTIGLGVDVTDSDTYFVGGGGLNFYITEEWSIDTEFLYMESPDKVHRLGLLSVKYWWR